MSPRTGRPTANPKNGRFEIRISEEEEKMLQYCCEQTGNTKAEIVRQGINEVYCKLRTNGK